MSRFLGRITIIGFALGVVSLGIAYALGGGDFDRLLDRGMLPWHACKGGGDSPGIVTERHLTWSGGDVIDIALPATVHFLGGLGSDVVVRGSRDLIANVDIVGDRIKLDCGWSVANRDIEIDLPGNFRRIALSGSGQMTLDNLNQKRLSLSIAGSGNVSGRGAVDHLTIALAGSGNARLANVEVKELKVEISGSGNVDAVAKDDADIKISGSGDVRLYGRPARLRSHVAGSGRISQLGAVEGSK